MGLPAPIARAAGRATSRLLRLAGRNASQLPGRVALALDSQLLASLAPGLAEGAVVVCGTNGKTTTTNVIARACQEAGFSVDCNWRGANMLAGITSAMLYDKGADWAVMEADELSCVHVLPQLKPRWLVLLNLFRDQLDRAGEIDHVQDCLVEALAASPGTGLIVCGDDPLSVGVARRAHAAGTEVLAFGIDEELPPPPDRVPEARFCQVCGAELGYEWRAYAQLGAFACPACDFARPPLAWRAKAIDVSSKGVSFEVRDGEDRPLAEVSAGFGGTYMVYNLLGAFAAASLMGVSPEAFNRALAGYDPKNGRLQHYRLRGREIVLNLAKNPTGFNQNISLMLADERPKAAFFVINDDYNDGKDISWIWDVDFERLAGEAEAGRLRVVAGGHRANDVQVRMKYAGMRAPIALTVAEALAALEGAGSSGAPAGSDAAEPEPLYVLCNYSALWPAKAELDREAEAL